MEVKTYGKADGNKGPEVQYVIHNKIAYIHFTGSNHWWDWIVNFVGWFFPIKTNNNVYQRFWYRAAEEVSRYFMKQNLDYEFNKILVTGLSKGGAEAVNFCEIIGMEYYVRTYGAPKEKKYNRRFSDKSKKGMVSRYANKGDLVAKLPPGWLKGTNIIELGDYGFNFVKAHSNYKFKKAYEEITE